MHIDSCISPAISKLFQLCGGMPELLHIKYSEKRSAWQKHRNANIFPNCTLCIGNSVYFSCICYDLNNEKTGTFCVFSTHPYLYLIVFLSCSSPVSRQEAQFKNWKTFCKASMHFLFVHLDTFS